MEYVTPKGIVEEVSFDNLLKQASYTVLYFYPKDNTPGCTIEAKDFTAHQNDFEKLGVQVIWVSKDSVKSHCGFQDKQWLSIGLISDNDTTLAQQFGARGEKKFMGRKYMWVFRNTYLLDNKGTIVYKREEVSAIWHVKNLLEYVKGISKS
jgi:thioredoxin-dependent peroxiredoxin